MKNRSGSGFLLQLDAHAVSGGYVSRAVLGLALDHLDIAGEQDFRAVGGKQAGFAWLFVLVVAADLGGAAVRSRGDSAICLRWPGAFEPTVPRARRRRRPVRPAGADG